MKLKQESMKICIYFQLVLQLYMTLVAGCILREHYMSPKCVTN
jgi:hypothetical protein